MVAPADAGVLDLLVECGAVQAPEHAVRGGLDGGCAWRVVHERELAEDLAGLLGLELLVALLGLEDLGAVERAGLDELHLVAVLALRDDGVTRLALRPLHRVDDDLLVLQVDGLEDEGLGQQSLDAVEQVLRLRFEVGLRLHDVLYHFGRHSFALTHAHVSAFVLLCG